MWVNRMEGFYELTPEQLVEIGTKLINRNYPKTRPVKKALDDPHMDVV